MKRIILSTLLSTAILFLWSGLTQVLPWGIPTTQNVTVQTTNTLQQSNIPNLVKLPVGELTTSNFDSQFNHKISTYTTDRTFSWIITQPLPNNYKGYFIHEAITQLLVSILLSILLYLTIRLNLQTRMILIMVAGIAASTATYGQLMNWWNIPAAYGLGVALNLVLGWLISSFVIARFILKSEV